MKTHKNKFNSWKIRGSLLALALLKLSCSSKPYTHFLIEPEVEVDESTEDDKTAPSLGSQRPKSDQKVTMKWNDGKTHSEINIPLASAGRIIIENKKSVSDPQKSGPRMVLPPPSKYDTIHQQMELAYTEKGLVVNNAAPAVSLSKARLLLEKATKSRNYAKALLISESVLDRYPSHPGFLKARGSLYLLIGEKQKAIESYEKSLEVEDDASVNRKLQELDKGL